MKNSKKGFTLVELLVVIAILAILATVAVVGYTSFTRKAEISNDSVIAKELTTLIQATDINDPVESFDDVIDALYANGFYLANLNTKTDGCFFVWESKNNQILLVDAKDGFKVLFPASYEPKGATWHLICSDKDLLTGLDLGEIKVVRAVASAASLQEFLSEGVSDKIYIDTSLVLDNATKINLNNSEANVTFDFGDNTVSSSVLSSVPFVVDAGVLNIEGGVISSAGELIDADGILRRVSVKASGGELNMNGTKITSDYSIPVSYDGGNGVLTNVEINATDNGLGAYDGSKVTLKDCVINVEFLAIFSSSSGGESAEVTIDGGSYKTTGNNLLGVHGGEIIVNSGDFDCGNDEKTFKVYAVEGSSITINGGTFNGVAYENLTIETLKGWINTSEISLENVSVTGSVTEGFVIAYVK